MSADPEARGSERVSEALRARGRTRVRIEGRSMYPVLRHGVQVIVEPVAYDELSIGDMVVFYDGRGLVCHRLIRKTNRRCYFKGDTNIWADPPVAWSQVLGRVTHIEAVRYIDIDSQRRRAVLIARFSYLYALYYNLLHAFGQCRWWANRS